jgi:hypothetical protein
VDKLSAALKDKSIDISSKTVRRMLKRLGYRMQGNRKVKSSEADHPDGTRNFST